MEIPPGLLLKSLAGLMYWRRETVATRTTSRHWSRLKNSRCNGFLMRPTFLRQQADVETLGAFDAREKCA